jgi:hypothetical protein
VYDGKLTTGSCVWYLQQQKNVQNSARDAESDPSARHPCQQLCYTETMGCVLVKLRTKCTAWCRPQTKVFGVFMAQVKKNQWVTAPRKPGSRRL